MTTTDGSPKSSMKDADAVGVVGLGLMGMALSERLIAAHFHVRGFDIEPLRMEAFARAGGEPIVMTRLAECKVVILAVYDDVQAEQTVEAIGNAAGGKPIVICATTCSTEGIGLISVCAKRNGLRLVESPISGTSAEVRAGEALALAAGHHADIDAAMPVLLNACPKVIRVGKLGDASRMKLAINLVLQSNRAALAEGIVFAETIGLDAAAFLHAVMASTAYSRVMDVKGEKMIRRDYAPQSRIAQTLKDADLIIDAAHQYGLELPMTSAQRQLLRATIELKGEGVDSSAVIEAIAPKTGRHP